MQELYLHCTISNENHENEYLWLHTVVREDQTGRRNECSSSIAISC